MALGTDFAKEFENYKRRCLELEEKRKMDEIELENLKKRNRELEGKITNNQKVVNNEENVKEMTVDLVDEEYEEDKILQLMIENKVLECEKQKAETELCTWKEKVKELESRVCELESNIKAMNEKVINDRIDMVSRGAKEERCSKVRKRLPFEKYECLNKNFVPSTPGVARSSFHGIIDISDEDVCYNEIPKVEKFSDSTKRDALAKSCCSSSDNLEKTNLEHIDEEHTEDFKVQSLRTRSAKRKRAANIITSDDETSDDDNVLLSTLKKQNSSRLKTDSEDEAKEDASKRCLKRLRKSESKNKQNKTGFHLNETICLHGNSSSEDEEDNDSIEGLGSEGESLGDFIVDSSESASETAVRSVDSCRESEDVLNEYKATLDKIGRKKVSNQKWDLEGDMLADFVKDPELCMRAVCALYRKQTKDEKASKVTIHHNKCGFSQPDAFRASKLAEFLTDGDSSGDLNKTVEELKQYDSKGIKLCTKLATKYSKQLFKIYQNKEDPYFLPK